VCPLGFSRILSFKNELSLFLGDVYYDPESYFSVIIERFNLCSSFILEMIDSLYDRSSSDFSKSIFAAFHENMCWTYLKITNFGIDPATVFSSFLSIFYSRKTLDDLIIPVTLYTKLNSSRLKGVPSNLSEIISALMTFSNSARNSSF